MRTQVVQAPQIARTDAATYAFYGDVLGKVNDFIRPAVEREMTARGEKQALDAIGDQSIADLNANSFEPLQPFSVRSKAFNAAADRRITSRAMEELSSGVDAAMKRADGNVDVLRAELDGLKTGLTRGIIDKFPGLATKMAEGIDRTFSVAERKTIELAQRRVIAAQREAASAALTATQEQAERLAITGATSEEIAAHFTDAQDAIALFGPRDEFTLNGKVYPADPSRGGLMNADQIASKIEAMTQQTHRYMLEAEFQNSEAPTQFAREFRETVFSGNSPFSVGESLEMLRSFDTRAITYENRQKAIIEAERKVLADGASEILSPYLEMGEVGVPVPISQRDRQRIETSLQGDPKLLREAQTQMAIADAQAETYGMSGPQLLQYVTGLREDVAAAAEMGAYDEEAVAILKSLEDQVKTIRNAVSSETVGLPAIEKLVQEGAGFESVDYEDLRARAAGNAKVLEDIAELEAVHKSLEEMESMNAVQRQTVIDQMDKQLAELARDGLQFGAGAAMTQSVADALEEQSNRITEFAETDPLKFAAYRGIDMASFEGAETVVDLGVVITERVAALSPAAKGEGVDAVVPLSQSEIEGVSDAFNAAAPGQRLEFVSAIADLGEDQANAIFEKMGDINPGLFATGVIYSGGNKQAASIMMRGANDLKLEGGSITDVALARETALGDGIASGLIDLNQAGALDDAAMLYARGKAFARGESTIQPNDITEGYRIAAGQQPDGSGGIVSTSYGTTIAPPGWTGRSGLRRNGGRSISAAISSINDEMILEMTDGGAITDGMGRDIDAQSFLRTIESLHPDPNDPYKLIPFDVNGGAFLTRTGEQGELPGLFVIDLRDFE